jgi:hypothetical protein
MPAEVQMAVRILTTALTLALATVLAGADEPSLPPAPDGYSWERCPAAKGALLRPDGWHFAAATGTDIAVYYIAKQPLDAPHVGTSLTLTVLPASPETAAVKPSQYVETFINHHSRRLAILKDWQAGFGKLKSRGQVTKENPKLEHGKKRWTFVLGNDHTGTLLIFIFETPFADWDQDWAVIEPVIGQLMLDDSV